ncbi:uncharacterized protein MONBRDRAFT_12673 [Monosiga brevicollis MX1]|uniref:BTB domain-containing protein n=1 Tax=Monosiga brevicollis TaxID=81824 RepID=A9VCZ4_MONBE|nr:uncharacterized protein MONBRDRAFT_12673 [Monosiga brevicollis MX1]EDQ84554.1 predicted protein [Monosiga brevicollis MX1]|eukprot:XP_001750581.1 hypothetical protein [Monosiga brevicollis MX1]
MGGTDDDIPPRPHPTQAAPTPDRDADSNQPPTPAPPVASLPAALEGPARPNQTAVASPHSPPHSVLLSAPHLVLKPMTATLVLEAAGDPISPSPRPKAADPSRGQPTTIMAPTMPLAPPDRDRFQACHHSRHGLPALHEPQTPLPSPSSSPTPSPGHKLHSDLSELLLVPAPAKSCYAGATFQVQVLHTRHTPQLIWRSSIYHPLLRAQAPVCPCLLRGPPASSTLGPHAKADLLCHLSAVLAAPELLRPCASCIVNQTAYLEARTDLSFFRRKANAHTPGTDPLPDSELRAAPAEPGLDLSALLTTGTYSDLKILAANSKIFRAHRTVLAAVSPRLALQFRVRADGGKLVVPYHPVVVARCLQFIYSRALPPPNFPPQHWSALAQLAAEWGLDSLHRFACAAEQLLVHRASPLPSPPAVPAQTPLAPCGQTGLDCQCMMCDL